MELSDRCCVHFDPSTANAEHNGSVSGQDYPLTSHLGFDSCWSKERGASNDPALQNWIPCEYLMDHTQCPQYQPSQHQRIKFVRVQLVDAQTYRFVVVDKIRLSTIGLAEYRAYSWTREEPENFEVAGNAELIMAENTMNNRDAETLVKTAANEFIATYDQVTSLPLTSPTAVTIEKRSFIASIRG